MKRSAFILCFCVLLSSCQQIVDNVIRSETNDYLISTYAGTYVGSFDGNDSGSLNVEVTKLGTAKITLKSSSGNIESFQGNVTKYGDFEGAISQSGFHLLGNLNRVNGLYNGTWKKNSFTGNWRMQKM